MNEILKEDLKYILADNNIDWASFEGKTVLITGANGFLPAYMVETLLYANDTILKEKVKVIGLIRNINKATAKFPNYNVDREDFKLIEQDVSLPINIEENIDYIIHAASQASPKYFFSDPVGTIRANTCGTDNLLQLAKEKNVKSFLYFSTGEVYGDIFEKKDIVNENDYGISDPLFVRNCYSESKRMGENMCASYYHQYGVPTKIVRPSHTYGPGFSFDDGRAFTSFVSSAVNNQNIILKSDGSACRSFIYLADATRGYFTVLLKGENAQAYNVGNKTEISILNLANIIIQASGNNKLKVVCDISNNQNPSSAASHGLLSIEKLIKLGWQPNISEQEGFLRTINYYKQTTAVVNKQ